MSVHTPPTPVVDVLIAEDDASMREGLRQLLEGRGYHCAEAADGLRAVELARRCPPRCVLLDLAMPGLDGFAVARRLRGHPRTRGARIHCLTGVCDPDTRAHARAAGCEAFLTKPIDPEALLRVVQGGAGPGAGGSVGGLTLAEAEGLLDWLENQGCTGFRVALEEAGVVARCVCPPGLRLARDEGGTVRLLRSGPAARPGGTR
jgi:CheY-like chemotaxis protein